MSANINWDEIRQEWETTKITFSKLAEKYGVKVGTLKSRRSREGWSRDAPKRGATIQGDATASEKRMQPTSEKNSTSNAPRKRSGNPNPSYRFPKHNKAALKHGFYSKHIPAETLAIMEQLQERSPADLIYDQIMIQYAAIIRAQQIMFVEDKGEMIKELKKAKYEYIPDEEDGDFEQVAVEEEYEFQFAWDRHATFLNAQSRAMSELRSLIKQFNEMAHEDDERRLKLEQMQLGIEKTRAEVENLTSANKSHGGDDWVEALQKVAEKRKVKNNEQ